MSRLTIEDADKLIEAMHHLRHKRHEVILLQVMSNDELEFPFRKWSQFENLELATDKIRLHWFLLLLQVMYR